MTKIGLYVSSLDDKILLSRDVPTVDEWLAAKEKRVRIKGSVRAVCITELYLRLLSPADVRF